MIKRILFYEMENVAVSKIGPYLRKQGQRIFRKGVKSQGAAGHEDYLVPSLRSVPISASKYPRVLSGDWVAPNATVIGDVSLKAGASLWHGSILRGDTAEI